MEKKSHFLPESISAVLRNLALRGLGILLGVLSLWMMFSLFFSDPYLSGVGAHGSFGNQGIIGNIVGFMRYVIGFIPTLFLLACLGRFGVSLFICWDEERSPEYNLLRGFVTLCVGCAGLGLMATSKTFGGLAGAIVAADLGPVLSVASLPVGIILFLVFLVMAGVLLHVKWHHVETAWQTTYRLIRVVLSAFHIIAPIEPEDEEVEEDEEEEETEEDEEEVEKPKRRRKVARKVNNSGEADDFHDYELPYPELLEKSVFGKNVITPELKQNAEAMEIHFAEYGVNGKVVGIHPGPIVTLYEFMPDSGTRMVDVSKTVKDMTRAMATENIRIAHIPSTQFIGVEMVNLKRQTVRYRGLIDNNLFINSKYKIPLALGVDIGGNPMYFDLAKMPHMLIAGRTGSGKSVFVQSIITSIVYHFTPDKCKLIIIDPKGVDFGFWDDIPHLITPIVKLDPAAAVNALKWAVREMEERYKQMQFVNARNVESYNEIMTAKREAGEKLTKQIVVGTDEETGEFEYEEQEVDMSDLPYIVIIIDEVADLMALARKEVEACVQRIAQKARAAGIHLVMATQRPDATTITGVIKANFPTRISFQARSAIDSITTLGEKGAENLLPCGDMLFSEAGRVPVRIHGAFIADEELAAIGDFLRGQGEPEYAEGVTSEEAEVSDSGAGASMSKASKSNDLYEQAKEIVLRDKKPTISYLQRRLGIGYNKAATLIERMETDGVLSSPDAAGKRHIL